MFSSNSSQVSVASGAPEALDFVSSASITKTTDWTGNADGATITFSFWVWSANANWQIYCNGNSRVVINMASSGISAYFKNTGDTTIATVSTGAGTIPLYTWTHVLFSINTANSAACQVYVNDISTGSASASSSGNIDMASTGTIYTGPAGSPASACRLSNFFMSKTFYDLTNSTNRRLFITSDLKPTTSATQSALTPLVYFPWTNPTTPTTNSGTGGNPTLTGTVVTSGRGPNQYNAPSATFNGSTQYLSRSVVGGSSKLLTMSFNVKDWTSTTWLVNAGTSGASNQSIYIYGNEASFNVNVRDASDTIVLSFNVVPPSGFTSNARWYNVVFSVDLSDTAKRFVYINGVAATVTWYTYTNTAMNLSLGTTLRIGTRYDSVNFFNGKLSNFYLNQSYIDLSSPINLAKFVTGTGIDASPVSLGVNGELPTGTSPLIFLPLSAGNPGKNYGTGGDFTVNSGPLTGSRSPNEYWGNVLAPANGAGSYTSNYLKRSSSLTGVTANKTLSGSFFFKATDVMSYFFVIFDSQHSGGASGFRIAVDASGQLTLAFSNSSSVPVLQATSSVAFASNNWYHVCFSVDMSNTAKRFIYSNNTSIASTWATYTNAVLPLDSVIDLQVDGLNSTLGNRNQTLLSEFYLTTDYIDFSQEVNRLKFRDAFGNPVDLTQQIEDAAIPNPAIYMRFGPSSFGTNSGTGGNFTVNGTITDGGQL